MHPAYVWTHCGRQPESVYCCCIHSVRASEKEVGRVVVGGVAVRLAGRPVAEEEAGLGSEVAVPGSWLEPVEMQFGDGRHHGCPAVVAWRQSWTLEGEQRSVRPDFNYLTCVWEHKSKFISHSCQQVALSIYLTESQRPSSSPQY